MEADTTSNTVSDTGKGKGAKPQVVKTTQGIQYPSEPIPKRLFSLKEASIFLGMTLWAVRQMVWKGQISYVKGGHKILIDRLDLDAYVERNKVTYH